jgi:hypothetical protein
MFHPPPPPAPAPYRGPPKGVARPPAPRRPQMDPLNPEEDFLPSASAPPTTAAPKPAPKPASNTVISAAPQLRDLRKEVTKLVPTAVRRKAMSSATRSATSATISSTQSKDNASDEAAVPIVKRMRVNAAPDLDVSASASSAAYTPSISHVPASRPKPPANTEEKEKSTLQDEYENFMKEMQDLL